MAKSWKELDYAGVESYIKDSLKALWEVAREKEYEKYPEKRPFTIEATEDGTEVYFRQSSYAKYSPQAPLKVDISQNGGKTWTEITASPDNNGTLVASLNAGDKLLIRGNNSAYGFVDEHEQDPIDNCNFLAYKPCYVYGNIMSLVSKDGFEKLRSVDEYAFVRFFSDYGEEFDWSWVLSKEGTPLVLPATTLAYQCYQDMFSGCTSLTTAPELPATNLAGCCYSGMFRRCTSLTTAPELPATTLETNCYSAMFFGCTSLTAVPALPATTLGISCCYRMFSNCTSLTTAPSLPATTLANFCYHCMFEGCTSLTAAPALPATTLIGSCYASMFRDCTSLTTAPALPAKTLANGCYNYMFYGCTNLSYIKALFTTTPINSYTRDWVSGVKATGTFVKSASATWNVTGANGVPSGWTVETE